MIAEEFQALDQEIESLAPTKVGLAHRLGWVGTCTR